MNKHNSWFQQILNFSKWTPEECRESQPIKHWIYKPNPKLLAAELRQGPI